MIIDTFSALRQQRDQKFIDTTKICFICGIEKDKFDRASLVQEGFKMHIINDHNMWNYLNFYIWQSSKDDDDGLETFVRKSIDTKDISWMPVNKAICLKNSVDLSVDILSELADVVSNSETNLLTRISLLQTALNTNVNNLIKNITTSPKHSSIHHIDPNVESSNEIEFFPIEIQKNVQYNISISILECTGLEFTASQEEVKIICKIQADQDIYKISTDLSSKENAFFKLNKYGICLSASVDDNRFCRIEISQNNLPPMAVLDIGFDELISSSGLVLEKTFLQSESFSNFCVLSLMSTAVLN